MLYIVLSLCLTALVASRHTTSTTYHTTTMKTEVTTLEEQRKQLSSILNDARDLLNEMAKTAINEVTYSELATIHESNPALANMVEQRQNAKERSFHQLAYVLRDVRVAANSLCDEHSFPSTCGSFQGMSQVENALCQYATFAVAAQALSK